MQIRLHLGLEDHLRTRANCNKLSPTHYIPLPLSPLYQPPRGLFSGVLWSKVENHTINLDPNTIIITI